MSVPFDEDIEVHVRTSRIDRTSLTFQPGIPPQGQDDLCASGKTARVNADQAAEKLAVLPNELVARISAFERETLTG